MLSCGFYIFASKKLKIIGKKQIGEINKTKSDKKNIDS